MTDIKNIQLPSRYDHLDVLKGILILLVVLAHLSIQEDIIRRINWFHMPAFFIISGLFLPTTRIDFSYVKSKTISLLLPYFAYCLVGTIVIWLVGDIIDPYLFVKFIYGGRVLIYPFMAFWFITAFWGSVMLYLLIFRIKNQLIVFVLMLCCYIVAHIESLYIQQASTLFFGLKYFIWNLDVSVLGAVYLYIGSQAKLYILTLANTSQKKQLFLLIFSGIVCLLFLYADLKGEINYVLRMKFADYTHWILDLIIPLFFFVFLLQLSNYLCRVKICKDILINIGRASLIIMYLHVLVFYVFGKWQLTNNYILFFSSIGLSMIFYFVVKSNGVTKLIFLGKR